MTMQRDTQPLPLSGIAIKAVYLFEASLTPIQGDEELPKASNGVRVGWDWRYLSPDVFEVKLEFSLAPSVETPYSALVATVGTFQRSADAKLTAKEFSGLQAVAILIPYARQFLANLTVNAFNGVRHVPSINVHKLMMRFDHSLATGIAQEKIGELSVAGVLKAMEPAIPTRVEPKALKAKQSAKPRKGKS